MSALSNHPSPAYVTKAEVIFLHHLAIERYGGAPGIREEALLESALSAPQAGFSGQLVHPRIIDMAAAYLWHLVTGHCFWDGNKRTGVYVLEWFLRLNGYSLVAEGKDLENVTREVAKGNMSEAEFANWLHKNAVERP